eukprot:2081888-Amphidinium_carterae.1
MQMLLHNRLMKSSTASPKEGMEKASSGCKQRTGNDSRKYAPKKSEHTRFDFNQAGSSHHEYSSQTDANL